MKYYIGDRFLFCEMIQKYTHAACMGDRVIACLKSRAEAEEVCRQVIREKQSFLDELLTAMNADVTYSFSDGYRDNGNVSRRHIADIRARYPRNSDIMAAVQRVRKSMEGVRVEELKVINN